MGMLEGKRLSGRSRRKRVENIKMDFQEFGWSMVWINLGQNRNRWCAIVEEVMNLSS